ncbi:hypothetical protein F5X96DRAFT_619330 [Biscogniauxia mediterranea]|nr:hypothetical protein F5X96DRAFT_619330 [Biscogniauxia mediterranea]
MSSQQRRQRLKYEAFWAPCPPGVDRKEMEKAYNNSNSRFFNKAKREEIDMPAAWAEEKRRQGITMLEAMSELATGWQAQTPGTLPGGEALARHLLDHFRIVVLPDFYNYTPAEGEDARAITNLGHGEFYHEKYSWMDIV